MSLTEHANLLGPELLAAIERKGYEDLTSVQLAVLNPALAGRDLRITSQTGSGKTIAIGLALRDLLKQESAAKGGAARPRALIVTPTRELAHQVEEELSWLYAETGAKVASTTGGASYRLEHRALSKGPIAVVGTPGRLLDHLKRGSVDPSQVAALILDEADRMLELGFREELEAIFQVLPKERVTHLVSATFSRQLRTLADGVQREPRHVEGTVLGAANVDIDHVIHIVEPFQRFDAMVNLLLANPDDQTLVFVRTRADVSNISSELVGAGFAAAGLSGEMDQAARTRALSAFRQGTLRVLVATDVAARGIDVQSVSRVIHAELPKDPDAYTHRSGRTGRAGRKGVSALLVPPAAVVHATRLFRALGIVHRFEQIPTPAQINRADDDRIFAAMTADASEEHVDDPRFLALAQRLIEFGSSERTIARLLSLRHGATKAREVRAFTERGYGHGNERNERPRERERPSTGRDRNAGERGERRAFTLFRVSWGKQRGADARRLLAMLCRRGQIRGTDVGAIRIEQSFSIVGVANDVVDAFEKAASKADPREPSVMIRRDTVGEVSSTQESPARGRRPTGSDMQAVGDRPLKRRVNRAR